MSAAASPGLPRPRALAGTLLTLAILLAGTPASAQTPDSETRTNILEEEQRDKVSQLHPYVPGPVEEYIDYAERVLTESRKQWHPFFRNAYAGGGFTLGAGYLSLSLIHI